MGTFGADEDRILRLEHPSEVPELGFSSSPSLPNVDEAPFIDKFRNVGLGSDSNVDEEVKDSADGIPEGSSGVLPLRPYAGDCPYYIRTGTCKFGLSCRFNHPVKRSSQAFKENLNDAKTENCGKIECKYYLTAGGCKYGKFCRYSHTKDDSEIVAPELNFAGLPIRLGEKECPYYMRCGSCGYGARCVFHHPEPTSMGGFESLNLTLNNESMIKSGYSFGSSNSDSAALLWTGASQMDQSAWTPHHVPNRVPYQNDSSSYMTNSFPQGMHASNEYKVSNSPHERSTQAYLPPGDVLELDVSMKVEEFPQRPGQPVCAYFLKTGDCKFKSGCRFHHPKDWAHKSDVCALSEKGLPLRPGKTVCRHYERFGICKFGRACMFDHPTDHKFSTSPAQSTSEPASSLDTGSW